MTQTQAPRPAAALQQAYAYFRAEAKPAPVATETRMAAIEQMYAYFG